MSTILGDIDLDGDYLKYEKILQELDELYKVLNIQKPLINTAEFLGEFDQDFLFFFAGRSYVIISNVSKLAVSLNGITTFREIFRSDAFLLRHRRERLIKYLEQVFKNLSGIEDDFY